MKYSKKKTNEHFGSENFVELIEARCPHKFHEYFDYMRFFEKQQYPICSLKKLVNNLYSEIAEFKHKKIFIEQTPWYGNKLIFLTSYSLMRNTFTWSGMEGCGDFICTNPMVV